MKIEHVAFQVADPAAMAQWYATHLGFLVRRASESPVVARSWRSLRRGHAGGLSTIPRCPCRIIPRWIGLAARSPRMRRFAGNDRAFDGRRGPCWSAALQILGGDELAMLRDPWGLAMPVGQAEARIIHVDMRFNHPPKHQTGGRQSPSGGAYWDRTHVVANM